MNDKEFFKQMVQLDEYAEYELNDGFVLVTDWEGSGSEDPMDVFMPYVVPPEGHTLERDCDVFDHELSKVVEFRELEVDETNNLYRLVEPSLVEK